MGPATLRPDEWRPLAVLLLAAAVVLAATVPNSPATTLVLLGVLAAFAYLRTPQRWLMAAGAPLAGLGIGVALGGPPHAALGIAAGLTVDALFACLRRRSCARSLGLAPVVAPGGALDLVLPDIATATAVAAAAVGLLTATSVVVADVRSHLSRLADLPAAPLPSDSR